MAALDDLLARIEDLALRADLEREISPLRAEQELGLVFERHLPERVRLPGLQIRRGDSVEFLSQNESLTWKVLKVASNVAQIRARDSNGDFVENTVPTSELVVVREFGEPIYPGVRSVGRIERGGDKPFHIVLNAENFHGLETLLYTCEGEVDAIYIDPPYNTGARDWKYNNDYVDTNDAFRHSKWLSFMEKRLRLARKLLRADDSVLIVTIDEKEYLRLGMLLEQIFPAAKIQMITSVISPGGVSREKEFTRVNEFIFFVMIGGASPSKTHSDHLFTSFRTLEDNRSPIWRGLLRGGSGPLRQDSPLKFYPILVDAKTERIIGAGDVVPPGVDRATVHPAKGQALIWPLKSDGAEGRWELARGTFLTRLGAGYVKLGSYNKELEQWSVQYLRQAEIARIQSGELLVLGTTPYGHLNIEYAPDRQRVLYAKTVWNEPSHDAGTHGSGMLKKLIPGRKFPYPKSLYAVEDTLRQFVLNKPNALILDFFGGSGTTTHAVMRLNRSDNGQRRSILVTNNEVSEEEATRLRSEGLLPGQEGWEKFGIFHHVAMPRIKAAVTGVDSSGKKISGDYKFNELCPLSEGFSENVEFLEVSYEDPDRVRLGKSFQAIAPLLWISAGAAGPRVEKLGEAWENPEGSNYGVLFDSDAWPEFIDSVLASKTLTIAYIVTDSEAVFQRIASELPSNVKAVRLYESYLRSFAINTGLPA